MIVSDCGNFFVNVCDRGDEGSGDSVVGGGKGSNCLLDRTPPIIGGLGGCTGGAVENKGTDGNDAGGRGADEEKSDACCCCLLICGTETD